MQLADDPISTASLWTHELLFGSVLAIMAVIAVAFYGFSLLRGHLAPRRGMTIIVGIFLAVGAPFIARELMSLNRDYSVEISQSPKIEGDAPVVPAEEKRSPYSRSSVSNR